MKGYVQVYRNLNKKLSSQLGNGIDPKAVGDQPVYSVRGSDGLVKKHLCHFVLHDCTFRVSDKGNERVRGEKRKNVHAYIRGERVAVASFDGKSERITYNPYKHKSFVSIETGKPVYKKDIVSIDGRHILGQ